MLGQGRLFCKEYSFVFETEVLFQFVTLILITKAFFFPVCRLVIDKDSWEIEILISSSL